MTEQGVAGSFRDPSGFLFIKDGVLYRQVNSVYRDHYDHLMNSGLYDNLVKLSLLVRHIEASASISISQPAYKVIKPDPIKFISYPYEWCFSQMKDAALAVLEIEKVSLGYDMTLKDCPAYNMQFSKGKALLIDTLSFEIYAENKPWSAYRQFCQHFLAPLALMSYRDICLNQMSRVYLDGIPLDLAAKLLPSKARFNLNLFMHIYMHAASQDKYTDRAPDKKALSRRISKTSLLGLIDSLEHGVRTLKWRPGEDDWYRYYSDVSSCPDEYQDQKKQLVSDWLDKIKPGSVWDLGANTGKFSRIACEKGIFTLSLDSDPACVEGNYLMDSGPGKELMLPLVIDLTNPSPGIGWDNTERTTLWQRGHAETVLALALVHHLAITNNLPLDRIASFFRKICNSLIIEFVPKNDPNTQKLLSSRADIFPDYTREMFEEQFSKFFKIISSSPIKHSGRILYLMK
ncbi:MAG: SAM-dependent methyltransferase [Dehalococcoidia bacterium]|nr:MAG: SAM-dependent methyltransferase [Dehalococcoidia bacterium]